MKATVTKISATVTPLQIKFIIMLLLLAMLVLGAGAPACDGGGGH